MSIVSFLRPANTTPYAAGDVISDSATGGEEGALAFPDCGRTGIIKAVTLAVEETDTINFNLFVFNSEPTNFLDNAALALVTGDLPKLIGVFSLPDTGKFNGGTNREHYQGAFDALNTGELPYVTTDGKLYGLLVTRSVYTPISACKFHLKLHLLRY